MQAKYSKLKATMLLTITAIIILTACSTETSQEQKLTPELTFAESQALALAITDEYKALETYKQVLTDHGQINPFPNIIQAEQTHVDILLQLFERYNTAPPDNPWKGNIDEFNSIKEACEAAIEGELNNAALYDNLKTKTDKSDILGVFNQLQSASRNNHLSAFQKCIQRES